MKNVKLLSLVLVLMMITSCFVTGFASATTYTEAEILAGTTSESGYDFTKMTADEIAACVSANTRISVGAEGGAKLSINHASTFNGEIQLKDLPYSRTETKAVKVTFVAPDAGTTVDVSLFSNNTRLRLFTYNNNGNVVLSCSKNAFSNYVVTPGTTYSVIAKQIADDTISVYAKSDAEANYTEILANKAVWDYGEAATLTDCSKLSVAGDATNDYAIYKDITLYGVGVGEAEIIPGLVNGGSFDFAQMTDAEIAAYGGTSGHNATVSKNNGIQVGMTQRTNSVKYAAIKPALTYSSEQTKAVKVTFVAPDPATNATMSVDLRDGTERLRMYTNASNQIGFSSTGLCRTYTMVPGVAYTVLAVKDANGNLDGYMKREADAGFKQILYDIAPLAGTFTPQFNLEVVGDTAGDAIVFKDVAVFVEGGTQAEILGANNAIYHQYDFDATYDAVKSYDATSADGFDFGKFADAGQSTARFNNCYLPAGGAAAIRFKINNSKMEAYFYSANNAGRGILLVAANGSTKFRVSEGTTTNMDYAIGTLAQNTWYTFILKDNGTGYDLYMEKDGSDTFTLAKRTATKNIGTGTQSTITGAKGTYVDYLTVYGPSSADAPTDANMNLLHSADFSQDAKFLDGARVTASNASIVNNALSLKKVDTANGIYHYADAGIPLGGYAEVSFKGKSLNIIFNQSNLNMSLICNAVGEDDLADAVIQTAPAEVGGSWQKNLAISHSSNIKYIYRIYRSMNNQFSIWRQAEGSTSWTKLFDQIGIRTVETKDECSLESIDAAVDYVKIYAPASEGYVMTDGDNTTLFVDGTAPLKYANELRVIANSNQDGVLVLGLYDGNDLETAMIEKVSAGVEKVAVKNVSVAKKVRVFFWDNFTNLNRLYEASSEISVSAE